MEVVKSIFGFIWNAIIWLFFFILRVFGRILTFLVLFPKMILTSIFSGLAAGITLWLIFYSMYMAKVSFIPSEFIVKEYTAIGVLIVMGITFLMFIGISIFGDPSEL